MVDDVSPEGRLGKDADSVAKMLIETIAEAHDSYAAAGSVDGAHFGRNKIYAQIWADLPRRVCELFSGTVMSATVRPGHAQYELPVVNDSVIFPWRLPTSASLTSMRFLTNPTRQALFRQALPEPGLFDPATDDEQLSDEEADAVAVVHGAELPVIMILVESSVDRLSRISWAIAQPGPDEKVHLTGQAVLLDNTAPVAAPVARSKTKRAGFDTGTPPTPVVVKRVVVGGGDG